MNVLFQKNEITIYKVPPNQTKESLEKLSKWKLDSLYWDANFKLVIGNDDQIHIFIENSINGKLYAKCSINEYPSPLIQKIFIDGEKFFLINFKTIDREDLRYCVDFNRNLELLIEKHFGIKSNDSIDEAKSDNNEVIFQSKTKLCCDPENKATDTLLNSQNEINKLDDKQDLQTITCRNVAFFQNMEPLEQKSAVSHQITPGRVKRMIKNIEQNTRTKSCKPSASSSSSAAASYDTYNINRILKPSAKSREPIDKRKNHILMDKHKLAKQVGAWLINNKENELNASNKKSNITEIKTEKKVTHNLLSATQFQQLYKVVTIKPKSKI